MAGRCLPAGIPPRQLPSTQKPSATTNSRVCLLHSTWNTISRLNGRASQRLFGRGPGNGTEGVGRQAPPICTEVGPTQMCAHDINFIATNPESGTQVELDIDGQPAGSVELKAGVPVSLQDGFELTPVWQLKRSPPSKPWTDVSIGYFSRLYGKGR